ncbi:hypothetical protein N161109_099 [Synechococcus phage S-CAM9]|uniref:Uncharacterized protein n=1 Tax=Synechococcus phage S-CAM9 TaxID=1883369 RepID=A0A1D8KPV3_9CAUD|nr:hypothetical protein BOW85_gp150 [Synechococcus phage S-CAM9]AOV60247.1 hypothetical protein S050808_099 [Synechococcus phage S-CAM9]AOV60703.1 hypothetical protein N161109_099 [Synechococcus phage S-CAM9]
MIIKIKTSGVKQPIKIIGFICDSYEKVPNAPIHIYGQPTYLRWEQTPSTKT